MKHGRLILRKVFIRKLYQDTWDYIWRTTSNKKCLSPWKVWSLCGNQRKNLLASLVKN